MIVEFNGIVLDLDERVYHAHSALSSTGARWLLKAPALFRHRREQPEAPKKEFDLGHAVHAKVLGVGAPIAVIPDDVLASNGALSTKAAKEWVEQARAGGKVPLKRDIAETIDGMAEAVLADAAELFEQDGHAEASLFATDPETGVELRARFDYLAPVGVDLKTTAKLASPAKWPYTVYDLGYDVQQGHYQHVRRLVEGDFPFVFVAVETEPPYLVGQYQLDREFTEMADGKARRAREVYARCLETGLWPRRTKQIQLIAPPMSAVYDYQDNYS